MAYWILFASVVGAILIRTSLSLPLPNTEVNAQDSLPNLLASVLSTRNGRTIPQNQVQYGQRPAIFSKTAPNSFIHSTAFQRNPESQFQIVQRDSAQVQHHSAITNAGQHGALIGQGIFNKRIEDSRESFEQFNVLQRHVPIKKTPTISSDDISSIQQQSSPKELPLFLVLRNDDHSTYNNILREKQKVTRIQGSSVHKSSESELSLFLPIIVTDDDSKKAEFRRLSIPSQFLPGFEHLSNHEPKELVDNLHGYVLDINEKDSHNLISFLKQSTLESVESRDSSSSSEEDYFQGVNNYRSRETDEDSSSESDSDEVIFEKNFRETYSEEDFEDDGGEKSSEEIKDFMIHPVIKRKYQGSFANSGTLFLGAPVIVPKHPHHSLTAPKRIKGQNTSKFPLRTANLYSAISPEETSYDKNPGITKSFQLPTSKHKGSTQTQNYDPISSARGLSQTLSSLFIKRVPRITRFPSSIQGMASTPGVDNGSLRLIPSTLYNNKGTNHGISGVLGLGQPVSVGLLQ